MIEERMNAKRIEKIIDIGASLFGFEYKNREGNVDPIYNTSTNQHDYLLYFDGEEQTVHTLDEVMNTPFIEGHTLNEIADDLIITEYAD